MQKALIVFLIFSVIALYAFPTLPVEMSTQIRSFGTIIGDVVQGKSASGVSIVDDGGNLGVYIEDGGQVGIGYGSPEFDLDTGNSTDKARLGRAEIGGWPASTAYAYVGHQDLDHSASGNYALLMQGTGNTWVNAAANKTLIAGVGNNAKLTIETSGVTVASGVTLYFGSGGAGIFLGGDGELYAQDEDGGAPTKITD